MKNRINKLIKKAAEHDQWAVELCARHLLDDIESVDAQINLIGALHEAGCLKNVIKPYWDAFRANPQEWAARCIVRLRKEQDHDYWAVASLLGLPKESVEAALAEQQYQRITIRRWIRMKGPALHIATYSPSRNLSEAQRVLAPVIEIGSDEKSGDILDVTRWRAIIIKEQNLEKGLFWGSGFGSYCLQARLPYGVWRIPDEKFIVRKEDLLHR